MVFGCWRYCQHQGSQLVAVRSACDLSLCRGELCRKRYPRSRTSSYENRRCLVSCRCHFRSVRVQYSPREVFHRQTRSFHSKSGPSSVRPLSSGGVWHHGVMLSQLRAKKYRSSHRTTGCAVHDRLSYLGNRHRFRTNTSCVSAVLALTAFDQYHHAGPSRPE